MKFRDKNNIVLGISAFLIILAVLIAIVATTVEKKKVTSQTTLAVEQTTNKAKPGETSQSTTKPVPTTQKVVDEKNVPGKYIVITQNDPLGVRRNPDSNSERISELPKDSKVKVLATSEEWAYIAKDDVRGWVKKEFIKLSEKSEGPKYPSGKYTVNTESEGLGMRSKPSSEADRVGEIAKGKEVDVITVYGNWGFVKEDDTYGWVALKYMKKN